MAKHRSADPAVCRAQDAGSACNAGGSSSLRTRINAASSLMSLLRCAATHLKTSHRFLQHASNTLRTQALARQAQRTARAPLQPHLHSPPATPPHTLYHYLTPAPRHEGHVHIGRCSGQSLASEKRHIGELEARTRTKHFATTQPRGGSACCRRECAETAPGI
jgi:hypothetical protein